MSTVKRWEGESLLEPLDETAERPPCHSDLCSPISGLSCWHIQHGPGQLLPPKAAAQHVIQYLYTFYIWRTRVQTSTFRLNSSTNCYFCASNQSRFIMKLTICHDQQVSMWRSNEVSRQDKWNESSCRAIVPSLSATCYFCAGENGWRKDCSAEAPEPFFNQSFYFDLLLTWSVPYLQSSHIQTLYCHANLLIYIVLFTLYREFQRFWMFINIQSHRIRLLFFYALCWWNYIRMG